MGKEKLSKEEFVKKAQSVHGDFYDYRNTVYVNTRTKVKIICPIHGEFEQTPNDHLRGKGCKECSRLKKSLKQRDSLDEFVIKAKEKFPDYNYDNVVYINRQTKCKFSCPIHGEFEQTPNNLLNGHGCPKCGISVRTKKHTSTKNDFIEKAKILHGDFYDYSKTEYVNNHTKVCIICPEHGEFWQTPNAHLAGDGCTKCNRSRLEKVIADFLINENLLFEERKTFDWLKYKKKLHLDFYLPGLNVAIECQGIQHFEPLEFFGGEDGFNDSLKRDNMKRRLCAEHGITMLYFSFLQKEDIITDLNELKKRIYETKQK